MRRFIICMSALLVILGSVWLTALLGSHGGMSMSLSDCVSPLSATSDCASSPNHIFHVLLRHLEVVAMSGNSLPTELVLLSKLLAIAGLTGLFSLLLISPRIAQAGRWSIRRRELLSSAAIKRLRAWRITLQELHPSYAQ